MKIMFKVFKNHLGLKGILLLLLVILASCNGKNPSEAAETNTSENIDADIITITESQFVASNMALGKLTLQDFSTTIKANGMFDVPPENRASVSAYFAGYVK
ncbi:MAG: efflux RND transporter periplasmic adaptor subunit, partial [Lutibacter sp.]|nr:efflux RND transporter periplasmic adaptor subunit [Lutibacter sp.]